MTSNEQTLADFQQRIGHTFNDGSLLTRALTHKSYKHEARESDLRDNETYEFLGDSVLGFVIGDVLFRRFPKLDEGALSKMKAYLVSAPVLAQKARALGMGDALMLGVGEAKSGGRNKDSLLANLFEAMIAAIYLDGGLDKARALIESSFITDLDAINAEDLLFLDFKTALQEVAQGLGLPLPDYVVVDELGPDHDKRFVIEVRLTNDIAAQGSGSSKKEAQQNAAREALQLYRSRETEEETAPETASP